MNQVGIIVKKQGRSPILADNLVESLIQSIQLDCILGSPSNPVKIKRKNMQLS